MSNFIVHTFKTNNIKGFKGLYISFVYTLIVTPICLIVKIHKTLLEINLFIINNKKTITSLELSNVMAFEDKAFE